MYFYRFFYLGRCRQPKSCAGKMCRVNVGLTGEHRCQISIWSCRWSWPGDGVSQIVTPYRLFESKAAEQASRWRTKKNSQTNIVWLMLRSVNARGLTYFRCCTMFRCFSLYHHNVQRGDVHVSLIVALACCLTGPHLATVLLCTAVRLLNLK